MKIARVIPLFKTSDLSLFTNYRPVSVLPAFSKILERIDQFLEEKKLTSFLIININGFREKNHSTAHALIQLYDKLADAIDRVHGTLFLWLCYITFPQFLQQE